MSANRVYLDRAVKKFVNPYLNNMKDKMMQSKRWIQEKNYAKIGKFAHSLKGSGTTMGFPVISEFGKALEKAVARRNWDSVKKRFGKLSDYLASLEVNYK